MFDKQETYSQITLNNGYAVHVRKVHLKRSAKTAHWANDHLDKTLGQRTPFLRHNTPNIRNKARDFAQYKPY